MKIESWKSKVENWKLKIESWKLKIENWKLKFENLNEKPNYESMLKRSAWKNDAECTKNQSKSSSDEPVLILFVFH